MAGLLDFATDPQSAMMTQMALGLLSAGGPSSRPVSLGQAMGQAGQMGMQGYRDAQNNQMNQMKLDELKKRMAFMQNMNLQSPNLAQDALVAGALDLKDYLTLQAKDKPELVELDDPANPGRTVKKWVTPGKSDGTNIGYAPMKTPEGMRYENGQLVGIPGYVDMKKQIAAAGRTTINNNNYQEKEEDKAIGKSFGEFYSDLQKAGFAASGKIARYDRLGQLLTGVQTGKLTPATTQISALADSLGVSIDPNLPAKQAAEALSNEIALQLRNPSGGAGMPGALSDKDREFLVSMTPGLGKTPEGNKLIIETAKKLAKREMDVAKIARDYRIKNGRVDEGFYQELANFSNANPLFSSAKSTPSTNAASLPPKPSASNLVKGTIYNTARGPAKWNGLQFETVGQ